MGVKLHEKRRSGSRQLTAMALSLMGAFLSPAVLAASGAEAAVADAAVLRLSPMSFAQMLAHQNADVQSSRLNVQINDHLREAEQSVYEPIASGMLRQEGRYRENTVEEQIVSSNLPYLDEKVNTRSIGLRAKLPSGADISASYQVVDRKNNVIANQTYGILNQEYNSMVTVTFQQPLLRGSGRNVTETDLRVAELEFEIAKQQFKQQLLKSITDGMTAYWLVYKSQNIMQLKQHAWEEATKLEREVANRIVAGKLAQSSALEIRSLVLNREIEMSRAQQAYLESKNKALALLNLPSDSAAPADLMLEGYGPLDTEFSVPHDSQVSEETMLQWPAYRMTMLRKDQTQVKMELARDQMRPTLNFVISASGTGFAYSRATAIDQSFDSQYPDWYVGFNYEQPVYGNQKAKGQYLAQADRATELEIQLDAIKNSFEHELNTFEEDFRTSAKAVQQNLAEVALRQQLYANERQRYELGNTTLNNLEQKDTELLDSTVRMHEHKSRYEISRVMHLLYTGNLLTRYGISVNN